MAQSSKTIQFWDDFYTEKQDSKQEWIVQPSPALVAELIPHFPTCAATTTTSILEIGCGTSTLSQELLDYFLSHPQNASSCLVRCSILATDVSEVCIRQNMTARQPQHERLQFRILDMTCPMPDMYHNRFDVILDKGCLDTFLFRSKVRGRGRQPYSEIVRSVLDNVHTCLASGGVYLVMSPRQRFRSLRDYRGFDTVQRHRLQGQVVGELEGTCEEGIFLHVCTKNDQYTPGVDEAFPGDDEGTLPKECPKCSLSFSDYCYEKNLTGRYEELLHRKWKGHIACCGRKRR